MHMENLPSRTRNPQKKFSINYAPLPEYHMWNRTRRPLRGVPVHTRIGPSNKTKNTDDYRASNAPKTTDRTVSKVTKSQGVVKPGRKTTKTPQVTNGGSSLGNWERRREQQKRENAFQSWYAKPQCIIPTLRTYMG